MTPSIERRCDSALGLTWEGAGLDRDDLIAARASSAPLAERLDLSAQLAPCVPHRWTGPDACPPGRPTLLLDDVSDIPFLVNIAGVEEYQHRARVRAQDGDLFAAGTPSSPGYLGYCERLGMGKVEFLMADPVGNALQVALACGAGKTFERLVERAKAAGGMAIHPYMGTETVWELARKLSAAAEAPVTVLAPPPAVTWIANDKSLFTEVVVGALDAGWAVETTRTTDVATMASTLLDMASRHARAGLKRTRCASGMGNAHFDLAGLRADAPEVVEQRLREFLTQTEWDGEEEVLVVAWEETDLSPSTQLWIPPLSEGPPRLDGIYEQILIGEQRVFLGSRPSSLSSALNHAIGASSLKIAAALQALGYVGRCSFDLLVVGDPEGEFAVRYVECNGRWGGTSTPMYLVERLRPGPRVPYRAQDVVHPGLVGLDLPEVLRRVGDDVYDPSTGRGRFVFYNVGPLADSGKLDAIAFGATQAEAEAALRVDLPRLLGLE